MSNVSRKWILPILFLTVLAAIIVGGYFFNKFKHTTSEYAVVGAILPLTGDLGFFGKPEQVALDLALQDANSNIDKKTRKMELKIEDSRSTAKDGVSALQKILLEKPQAVLTSMTIISMSTQPILTNEQIPQIAQSVHPEIATLGKNVFRLYYGFEGEMYELADLAKIMGSKRVAVIWINVPECEAAIKNNLTPALEKNHAALVASIPYNFGTQDFKPLIAKIKAQNPDLLIIEDFGTLLPLIIETAKVAGFSISQMAGGIGFLSAMPDTRIKLTGIPFVCPSYLLDEPNAYKTFQERFRKASGGLDPSYDVVFTYDAFSFIAKAIHEAKSLSKEDINEAMTHITEFSGVAGNLRIVDRALIVPLSYGVFDDKGQLKGRNYGR